MTSFCKSLSGISKDCTPNVGGVRRTFLNLLRNIDSITIVNNVVTDLTLINQNFVEYVAPKDAISYTIDTAIDDLGVYEYTHTLTFKISKRLPSRQQELMNLIEGSFDYVALVIDANNQWWLLGYGFGINANTLSGGSGKVKGDGSFYETSLSGIQRNLELAVDTNLALSLINPNEYTLDTIQGD
jgi:hypothetical protein